MAESYDSMAGSPINPDATFFKTGSQSSDMAAESDAVLAENMRMAHQNASEARYNPSTQKKSKKRG